MKLFAAIAVLVVNSCAAGSEYLQFEPNRGQASQEVQYLAQARDTSIFLTDSGLIYNQFPENSQPVDLEFLHANRAASWQPIADGVGTSSYLIGNNSKTWLRDIPHFRRIARRNIYPGIDLIFYGTSGHLEYDFVLSPGADPNQIELGLTGGGLDIGHDGSLLLRGAAIQRKPILYQTYADGSVHGVDGAFRLLSDDRAGFSVGAYDPRYPLTIDPVLESASMIGATGADRVFGVDPRIGIAGSTASADFPGVITAQHRGSDVFVYLPDQQSTVIFGGSGDDIVTSVTVQPGGGSFSGILVGGYTNSPDFPMLRPIQKQYGGGDWDGFLMYFGPGAPNLIFSTYFGGSGDDRILATSLGGSFGFMAATGSTTSRDLPLSNAWQNTPGGGVDGFAMSMTGDSYLLFSSYLGGSGDDRGLAIYTLPATTPLSGGDFYIGGDTRSPDWNGTLNGASDGYLIHVKSAATFGAYNIADVTRVGGSGEDRITAITQMGNGNLAVAGVTTSPDLGGADAKRIGPGGASDVFVSQISTDLQTMSATALIGGSGEEEPTSIAPSRFDELIVGGWTNSTDFPLTDPFQSDYGGGPEDGFLIELDSSSAAVFSTYYGGSGSDRITSVRFDDGQKLFAQGFSDSPNLPLKNPLQDSNAGSVDGFYTEWTVPVIHASGVSVGKNLAASRHAQLGDSGNFVGVPLTITSSDPAQVLLAIQSGDSGQASVTIANRGLDGDIAGRDFLVYCLTDAGTTPVTLTAPGYPSRTIQVRCVPSGLSVSPGEIVLAQSTVVTVVPVTIDPATNKILQVQSPRGGIDPIHIRAASTNPNLFEIAKSSIDLDSFTDLKTGFSVISHGAGSAEMVFESDPALPFLPSNRIPVRLRTATMSVYMQPVARDMVGPIGVDFNGGTATPNVPITFTSSDPSKALITTSPSLPGSPSITVNYKPSVYIAYVEMLDDSGPVSVLVSAPGMEPVTTLVGKLPVQISFFYNNGNVVPSVDLFRGDSTSDLIIQGYGIPPGGTPYQMTFFTRRAGAPALYWNVVSSDPSIVSTTGSLVVWSPGYPLRSSTGTLTAVREGTATVLLKPTPGYGADFNPGAIQINVPSTKVSMPDSMTVGYKLQLYASASLGGRSPAQTVPITLTSSDPSRVLLSTDSATPGQPSLTVSNQYGVQFYVQSLSGSGSVDIIGTAPGYTSGKTTVKLVPSGLAWQDQSISIYKGSSAKPILGAFALDPSNLTPFESQSLRAGLNDTVAFETSNPAVVTLDQARIPLATLSSKPTALLNFVGSGLAEIAISQPSGFTRPVGRRALRVKAQNPSFYLYGSSVGRNMQTPVRFDYANFSTSSDPSVTVTLSSADPAKLAISTSASDFGAASASVIRKPPEPPQFYMQALDGPSDVKITMSAPGFDDASFVVPILPSAIRFAETPGFSGPYKTNTQQDSFSLSLTPVSIGPGQQATDVGTVRFGLDPIAIQVNSSDPAVAVIQKNPVLLNSLTRGTQFQVKPLTPGDTDLTIVQPPGFVSPPPGPARSIKISVDGPAFGIVDLSLGKDLQALVTLGVVTGAAVINTDLDVVLTSSDPSRALLSPDALIPGSGSLTVHFLAGQSLSRGIYVQGLSATGNVSIQVAATGYRTTTAKVTLVPATLLSDSGLNFSVQDLNPRVLLRPAPFVTSQVSLNVASYQFRAGMTPFSVVVTNSNPSVVTLPSSTLDILPGLNSLSLPIRPVGAGTARLSFTLPDGFVSPFNLDVQVQGGRLNMDSPTIGKNLQSSVTVSGDNFSQNPVSVTLTSADASRLLISASPSTVGQPSITITNQPGQPLRAYLQALADDGQVNVTLSAPGYQSLTAQPRLAPAAAVLIIPSGDALTPLSAALTYEVRLVSYAFGSAQSTALALRPGAPAVTVQASLSDPKIGSLTPSQFLFNSGDSSKTFTFQPLAEGSALLSLNTPAGFADPLSQRQQLLTVLAARLSFSDTLSVGKDLVKSMGVRLPAAPAKALTLTLTSADPTRLLLIDNSHTNGAASVSATFSAGSSTASFGLMGLAAGGTVAVNVTSASLPSSTVSVAMQASGFRFDSPPTFPLQVGSGYSVQIGLSAVDPQTLLPEGFYSLRPGVAAVPVNVASSDASVLSVTGTPVFFSPGDLRRVITVSANSPGSAILTVQAPPGFATPSSGATASFSIR